MYKMHLFKFNIWRAVYRWFIESWEISRLASGRLPAPQLPIGGWPERRDGPTDGGYEYQLFNVLKFEEIILLTS